MKPLILLIGLGLASVAFASGEPPFHRTLKNGNRTAVVEVNQSKVTVRLKRDSAELPQSILLTISDLKGRSTTMELRALKSPSDDPGVSVYGGSLSLARESMVGIELSIPLRFTSH